MFGPEKKLEGSLTIIHETVLQQTGMFTENISFLPTNNKNYCYYCKNCCYFYKNNSPTPSLKGYMFLSHYPVSVISVG